MMHSTLNILMAQMNPTVGALTLNREKIISIIKIHQHHFDLIVFPELALTGYPPEDLLYRKEFHEAVLENLALIQQAAEHCHVIVGHPLLQEDACYNTASVFYQTQKIQEYYKQVLPNYAIFDECRYFTPGTKPSCTFEIKHHHLGLIICEDLWKEGPAEAAIEEGITTLIVINASPFDLTKQHRREALLRKYATTHQINLVYVNQIGGQDELLFDGQSMAVDQMGCIQVRAPAFEEDLCSVSITNGQICGSLAPVLSEEALLYQALVCGIRDYVQKNHCSGVLLGLSGGIDSALTLALAVDALGAEQVHAVLMPSAYTATMSNEDALQQIQNMQVSHSVLPIHAAYDSLLETLAPVFGSLPEDTTEENIQARIRGLLLMALSNKWNKLVLSTSNKSETALGYATLYGDMAGGLAVLKDVLKTQVYALAHYRNKISNLIPERVLQRPPSAELRPNQKDQDSLPEYAIVDPILKAYMEDRLTPKELIQKGFSSEDVYYILGLIKKNEFKRRQAPPGIKVSPTAFGRDWRFPITNGFSQEILANLK